MGLNIITNPIIEPISLPEVKAFLRIYDNVTDTSEDDYLNSLITAAREYCEGYQNRAYITQSWQLTYDYWPSRIIEIPKGKLQSIDKVSYTDLNGVTKILTPIADYVFSNKGIVGRLTAPFGKYWPYYTPYPLDSLVIEFTCGYGATADLVPKKVIQAMKLLVNFWYEYRIPISETRSAPTELKFAVSALLSMERITNL